MIPPRNILVPVDFSETSALALDHATALASKLGATLILLNVVTLPVFGIPEAGIELTPSLIDDLRDANQKALDKLADARRSIVNIGQVVLRIGDPRDAILEVSEAVSADLIVMGTHGRRGISRVLLGSVAESVLRTASCPVLTIRAPKHQAR